MVTMFLQNVPQELLLLYETRHSLWVSLKRLIRQLVVLLQLLILRAKAKRIRRKVKGRAQVLHQSKRHNSKFRNGLN